MIRTSLIYVAILATLTPAPPKYIAVMFYRSDDAQCRSDLMKIKWSGSSGKLQYVELNARPQMAAQYKVTRVPTYVIWAQQGQQTREVFRTNDLRELDRVTRGRR